MKSSTYFCTRLILLLATLTHAQASAAENSAKFVILIASYNNKNYYEENLKSACYQKSTRPYRVIYINDCSTDGTGELVENFVKDHHLDSMVTIVNNPKNYGQLYNYFMATNTMIKPEEIVVHLDGDDLFAHNEVLLTLEKYYSDPNVWMTYGSCLTYPSMEKLDWVKDYPSWVIEHCAFRKIGQTIHHLRTFRAALFQKIRKEDFMKNGSFLKTTGDTAFLLPLFEMCAPCEKNKIFRAKAIPEILYYWRTDNPLSEGIVHAEEQRINRIYIEKELKPYTPIPQL